MGVCVQLLYLMDFHFNIYVHRNYLLKTSGYNLT